MRITIAGSQKWASTTGTANEPAGLGDYTSMPGNAATLEMRSIRAICGAGSKKMASRAGNGQVNLEYRKSMPKTMERRS